MGWFSYAPLSEKPYSSLGGVDYWALGLLVIGIGTVSTAINFLVTIASLRAPGMALKRLPLFTWMSAVNSFLIILAFPALNSALFMLLIDRSLHGRWRRVADPVAARVSELRSSRGLPYDSAGLRHHL